MRSRLQNLDGLRATARGFDDVTQRFDPLQRDLAHRLVVFDHENDLAIAEPSLFLCAGPERRAGLGRRARQMEADCRSAPFATLDRHEAARPLDEGMDAAEPEADALALRLGGEERL